MDVAEGLSALSYGPDSLFMALEEPVKMQLLLSQWFKEDSVLGNIIPRILTGENRGASLLFRCYISMHYAFVHRPTAFLTSHWDML